MDTRFSERFTVKPVLLKSGFFVNIVDAQDTRCVRATIHLGYFRGGPTSPASIEVTYDPAYFDTDATERDSEPTHDINGVTWADLVARATPTT